MASQEEDNKLECISNVNKEQERYYLNVYKKYESILNDKSEKFENKVQSLIEVWKSISELNFSQFDIKYIIQIIDWAKLHALNIVLTGEWRSTKESFRDGLLECIEKAQASLASVNDAFSTRCQKLADVVKKPWEDPVLYNLIQDRDAEIGSKEIEFFCVETAYLVSVRLKKLCENHCEDLALNLVTNFLKCKKQATVQNFNLNATETQLWFIFDIYIALLYKFQDKSKILEQFEDLQLLEGVQLIKRFAKKRVKISKIWRNCHKIAIFGSRFYLSKALIKYNEDLKEPLTDLLRTYLILSNTEALLQEFVVSVRNLTNLADAEGLCIMCEVIHRQAADKLRHFAIEMYIRALTTDMNELERLKHANEDDKMKLTTSRLAHTFSNLADLLDDHIKVARECVLTAFSLEPTKQRLNQIEEMAKRSGFPVLDTGQEWKCRLHPPVLASDDLAWVCSECGEWMSKPELTAPLQMNTPLQEALQESVLGISEALCDDLVVCVSNPRYQILSWLLSWGDLYRLCILYLNDPEKTKNFVTELKFVDVDYSMFDHIKREPVDEYTGIEKGYEQYLDLDFVSDEETSSVSEDSMSHDRSVGLGSDGTGETYLPIAPPKSDPNTLKSLRMFRPSLKRKKDEPEQSLTKDKKVAAATPMSMSESTPSQRPSGSTYLPEMAGVTMNMNNPSPNKKNLPAAGNFSNFEYKDSLLSSSSANTQMSASTFRNQQAMVASTSEPVNSVFNTTNLSNVTSTGYVSNIIKSSGLTFGVPKVAATMTSTLLQANDNIQNHGSNNVTNLRQGSFATPNAVAKKNVVPHNSSKQQQGTFATPSNVVQKSSKSQSLKSHSLAASPSKSRTSQVSSSTANDLDAILKEVVKGLGSDLNQTNSTDSKNGVAATLLQLGGQVASNHNQLIQVPHLQTLSSLSPTQTKLQPETSLLNGTTDVCKTTLRSSNRQDKRSLSGETSSPVRKKMLKEETRPVSCLGKAKFKIMDLKVNIPRLNLEQYHSTRQKKGLLNESSGKSSEPSTKTTISQGSTIKQSICKLLPIKLKTLTIRITPLEDHLMLPREPPTPMSPSKQSSQPKLLEEHIVLTEPAILPKSPEEHLITQTEVIPLPIASSQLQYKVQLPQDKAAIQHCLKSELSIHLQDKLLSQTEVPLVQVPLQVKAVCPQESPTLRCPKELCSLPQEVLQPVPQPVSRPHLQDFPAIKAATVRKSPPAPLRLDKVIIVPQEKVKEILSQASFTEGVYKTTFTPSELHDICLTNQKNKGVQPSSGMSLPLLEMSLQLLNQKQPLSTCLNFSQSPKIATTDCDKDKLENGNKKTDLHSTESVQDVLKELQIKDEPDSSSEAKVSSLYIDEVDFPVNIQIAEESVKTSTHNSSSSIMTDIDTASDNDVAPSEQIASDSETRVVTISECKNEVDNRSTTKETIENVNKSMDCDNRNKTDLHIDSNSKEPSISDSDETLARIEKWLKDAAKWNTKDSSKSECSLSNLENNRIKENKNSIQPDMVSIETTQTSAIATCRNSINLDDSPTELNEDMKLGKINIEDNDSNSLKASKNTTDLEGSDADDSIHIESFSENTNNLLSLEIHEVITETIVYSHSLNDIHSESITTEEIVDTIEDEISETGTTSTVAEIKDNLQESIQNQKCIKETIVESEGSDTSVKLPFQEKDCKELRISIKKPNFINYIHNYCQNSKDLMPLKDAKNQVPPKNERDSEKSLILPDALKSLRNELRQVEARVKEAQDNDHLFADTVSDSSSDVDKENIKEPFDTSVFDTCVQAREDRMPTRIYDGPLSCFKNYPPERLKVLGVGDFKPRKSGVKIYSNTRKRKHNNVPCFKLDQEKDSDNEATDRHLTVALKRLPEVIARPNVTVLVSDPFKSDDSDLYKKTTPLVDCNIRNEVRKKLYNFSQQNRKIKIGGKKFDYRDDNETPVKRPRGRNNGIHVHIYEDRFYSMIAKVSRPLKAGFNVPISFSIPGLNDYSEILPRNVNHIVNVVQHSMPRSSTTVTNQNTQISTQVTPHIQRIGQPKLSDRKPDHYEDDSQHSPSNSTVASTSSTSQSSTLINILSSPKPGQKSNAQSRQTPYVNILSQQILKPTVCQRESTATVIKVEPEEHAEVQATKSVNTNLRIVTTTTQAGATPTTSSPTQAGTILQFICKSSSLPKFQQAFGKTVYQSGSSSEGTTEPPAPSTNDNSSQAQTATVVETKKIAAKTLPVNVQPITGNVIFRGQVPVGQTVSLIPPGSNTRQLFRITGSTHEQISLVKETVIQNKMSALLAAALQGKPKITEQNGELVEEYSATRITLCRPGTVPPNATRIVKPVQLQIPGNVVRAPQPNVSSTTLEQLREFDMVYKQVKERSSNPAQPEVSPQSSQESPQQQRISFTYVNQVQKYTQLSPVVVVSSYSPMQQSISPALNVTSQAGPCLTQVSTVAVPKVAVKSSKGKSIKSSVAKTSPTTIPAIPKPQQKPQEDEHTTQRIFDILAEYAEQLRNSPDLNNKPAPRRRSNPPTNPSSNTSSSSSSKKKKKKSSSSSTSNMVETDNEDLTMGSEDSSGGNVVHQLSMTDEEQSQSASITPTESNLEPATSNIPTSRPLIVTDTSNQSRNVIIADSSVGEALKIPNTALLMPGNYIMPVSVMKGGQQIAVVSGGSKILTTMPARSGQNMLLFQSFVNQNKKGGISTVKYSTLQPFSSISTQNVAGVSTHSPVMLPSSSVATMALGQPITLKKIDDNERGGNTELLLTIAQPRENNIKAENSPDIPQPDSSTNLSCDAIEVKIEESSPYDSSRNEVFNNIQKAHSVATSVIASVIKKEEREDPEIGSGGSSVVKEEPPKQGERIGSVLVNALTSNGPMLSHTNTRYRKPAEGVESTTVSTKEFNHNVGKATQPAAKIFKNNAVYYAIRTKKAVSKKIDSEMQKQAAMERELRLQKTLSEECEDLGVDEPSTSDLFPEADLLFDSNNSPSYDQSGQKIQGTEAKTKDSMHLFSDDENSGPLRNDLFDYVEYHAPESGVDHMNGNNASNESASSCDDSTLLPNCGTMSEVTLNSPISPEYSDSSHAVNKYKYKYTNRKKGEKIIKLQPENWRDVSEVTSSEDAMEFVKDEETPLAVQEETVIEEAVTEVETVVMDHHHKNSESDFTMSCPIHGSMDNRVSRKIIKKACSCFNGSRSPIARKRVHSPKSQGTTTNKKMLLSKNR